MQLTLGRTYWGVLIPSLYTTSLRTPSLRPLRVPSDQNTKWRLSFQILLIRDKNSLSLHICQMNHTFNLEGGGRSLGRRTRAIEWHLRWGHLVD